jgi:membrane associated rhomboid family serine protease
MWFLAVAGLALEDRFGRLVFAGIYLSGGLFAGWAHMEMSPIPAIGASGAVAACMGMFALSNPAERIRMGWAGLLPIPINGMSGRGVGIRLYPLPISFGLYTFQAPAFVVAALWVGAEIVSEMTEGLHSGVARWAHIGGFAYGAAVALLFKVTGIERRLNSSTKRRSYRRSDLTELRARASSLLPYEGQLAEALVSELEELRKRKGSDFIGAEETLMSVARSLPPRKASLVYGDLILERIRSQMNALEVFEAARINNQHWDLSPRIRLSLAESLIGSHQREAADILSGVLHTHPQSVFALRAYLAQAKLALKNQNLGQAQEATARARTMIGWAPEMERPLAELEQQVARSLEFGALA